MAASILTISQRLGVVDHKAAASGLNDIHVGGDWRVLAATRAKPVANHHRPLSADFAIRHFSAKGLRIMMGEPSHRNASFRCPGRGPTRDWIDGAVEV
jgi:hypothetical protein